MPSHTFSYRLSEAAHRISGDGQEPQTFGAFDLSAARPEEAVGAAGAVGAGLAPDLPTEDGDGFSRVASGGGEERPEAPLREPQGRAPGLCTSGKRSEGGNR